MLIKVYAPPYCNHNVISDKGYVSIREGATLGELLKKIEMPFLAKLLPITTVNNEQAKRKQVLKDGDVVSIFHTILGG